MAAAMVAENCIVNEVLALEEQKWFKECRS